MKYRGWIDHIILTMERDIQLLAMMKNVCCSTKQSIRGVYKIQKYLSPLPARSREYYMSATLLQIIRGKRELFA